MNEKDIIANEIMGDNDSYFVSIVGKLEGDKPIYGLLDKDIFSILRTPVEEIKEESIELFIFLYEAMTNFYIHIHDVIPEVERNNEQNKEVFGEYQEFFLEKRKEQSLSLKRFEKDVNLVKYLIKNEELYDLTSLLNKVAEEIEF